MRVRIRRFRRDDRGCPWPHDVTQASHPEHSMLPIREALISRLAHSGVIGADVLSAVERSPVSSALPDIESSGVFPARCAVLRPLLTPLRVTPSGSPHVRARCFPARPPHLPRRRNRSTSLCCANSSPRRRPSMRFLSVSPLVSSSLPSPGRLPSRSWPRVVGLSCHHAGSSYKGLAPRLQRAHDGRTHGVARYGLRPPVNPDVRGTSNNWDASEIQCDIRRRLCG